MKTSAKFGMAIFVVAILLLAISSSRADESVVTPAMVGHWEGNARIIVSWCHQTNLVVAVDILANGNVTGKIGDATLVAGHFLSHRSWPWRHTIVTGKLYGDIVAGWCGCKAAF
jgi:hypothetical protein